jgi:2-methylfumaryl-CoA hydratase
VVLEYARWVMVRKREKAAVVPVQTVPALPDRVTPEALGAAVPAINPYTFDKTLSGSEQLWADYVAGERIDHLDGMTLEEAEHMMATRLYQNTAKVHFNQHTEGQGRFGRRLVYGGVVISLARALSFNGLANAFHVAAINGGRHVAPAFAGDTIYAWSEVVEKAEAQGRRDIGFLRIRTIATKNMPCAGFPLPAAKPLPGDGAILDLDYWVAMPR